MHNHYNSNILSPISVDKSLNHSLSSNSLVENKTKLMFLKTKLNFNNEKEKDSMMQRIFEDPKEYLNPKENVLIGKN